MGKNKLRKFSEMEKMECVFQYPYGVLQSKGGFPFKGRWHEVFGNDNPIVLELGCGKGEYTVGLARHSADKNFIGIDVKGARMYTGASIATNEGMDNVRFLRTDIELLNEFFSPEEISEIWITFADPQMKKQRKRLTSSKFLETYRQILTPKEGLVHLKTDSPFLFTYTLEMAKANGLDIHTQSSDLYQDSENGDNSLPKSLTQIQTFYEQQWLSRGKKIKYLRFSFPSADTILEDIDDSNIEKDDYRAYTRHTPMSKKTQASWEDNARNDTEKCNPQG